MFVPQLGLQIAQPESMEDIKGEASFQQKALHGVAIMLVDMIGVPVCGQFIEGIIF
jgi:hypothetical protein